MTGRLLWVWEQVRGSLWALPLAIAAACASLAILTLNVNVPWTSEAAWLYSGSARQAPQFAASLVGAMVTLTSLAFSITMVVLTLAAQQLGPASSRYSWAIGAGFGAVDAANHVAVQQKADAAHHPLLCYVLPAAKRIAHTNGQPFVIGHAPAPMSDLPSTRLSYSHFAMQSTLDGEAAEVRRQFDAAPKLVFEAADAEETWRGALNRLARIFAERT